jgi:hypothetical protein
MSYDDDADSGLSKLRYNKRQNELPKELQGDTYTAMQCNARAEWCWQCTRRTACVLQQALYALDAHQVVACVVKGCASASCCSSCVIMSSSLAGLIGR